MSEMCPAAIPYYGILHSTVPSILITSQKQPRYSTAFDMAVRNVPTETRSRAERDRSLRRQSSFHSGWYSANLNFFGPESEPRALKLPNGTHLANYEL